MKCKLFYRFVYVLNPTHFDLFVHLQKNNYKQEKNSVLIERLMARVTLVNSNCNQGRPTQMVFKGRENKKKRNINRECYMLKWAHLHPVFLGQIEEWELKVKCFWNN